MSDMDAYLKSRGWVVMDVTDDEGEEEKVAFDPLFMGAPAAPDDDLSILPDSAYIVQRARDAAEERDLWAKFFMAARRNLPDSAVRIVAEEADRMLSEFRNRFRKDVP